MSSQPGFGPPVNPYDSSHVGPQWGVNPYSFPPGYEPPRRSRSWLWILLGIGGLVVVAPLCCLGCGGLLLHFGFEVVEGEIVADLNTDPIIQQHIGQVVSAEIDLWDSFQEDMKNPVEDDEESWYVFDIQGTKNRGRVIGKSVTNDDDLEEFRDGRLILPSGLIVKLSK